MAGSTGVVPATDTLPDAVEAGAKGHLILRGRADWGKEGRGPFWIEPFLAWLRVAGTPGESLSYRINFADATRGLAKFPYGKHVRRPDWFYPAEWLYVFSKGTWDESNIITTGM